MIPEAVENFGLGCAGGEPGAVPGGLAAAACEQTSKAMRLVSGSFFRGVSLSRQSTVSGLEPTRLLFKYPRV